MFTNSHRQLDDHFKDGCKSPLLTCVSKHHASHWKLHVTTRLLWLLWFASCHRNYSTEIAISSSEIIVQRRWCSFDLSQNTLHNWLPENSDRWRCEHISKNFAVFWDNFCISSKSFLQNFQKFFHIFRMFSKFFLHLRFSKISSRFTKHFSFSQISLKFYLNLKIFPCY